MRFVIDEDLPESTAETIALHGHESVHVREVGLRGSRDWQVADYARLAEAGIISGDLDFADIRKFPPEDYLGIIVLRVRATMTPRMIADMLSGIFGDTDLMANLPGKLAIVEPGRIRLRTSTSDTAVEES